MSWLDDLSRELRSRGVPGRDRRRIVLELRDHIACEPGCEERLGNPRELAVTFADELATAEARSSALATFAALAVAAVVLIVSQITLARFAHYPGYSNGISTLLFFPAILGMLVAPQIALVAGSLAAWRALRRRRAVSLPAGESRSSTGEHGWRSPPGSPPLPASSCTSSTSRSGCRAGGSA
jgi:hypothetical protein